MCFTSAFKSVSWSRWWRWSRQFPRSAVSVDDWIVDVTVPQMLEERINVDVYMPQVLPQVLPQDVAERVESDCGRDRRGGGATGVLKMVEAIRPVPLERSHQRIVQRVLHWVPRVPWREAHVCFLWRYRWKLKYAS